VSGSSHPLPAVTPLRLVSQAVSVRFGAVAAVIEVSADIEPGERVLVTGRAASGKSTWLKCLAGLQRPSSGVVRWDLQDVSTLSIEARRQQQRSFGMVFQSDALFDSMTVLENVCLPLTRRQMPADQARATAEASPAWTPTPSAPSEPCCSRCPRGARWWPPCRTRCRCGASTEQPCQG